MKMCAGHDAGDFVEIRRLDTGPGDLLVTVEARRRGFAGVMETWVHREDWLAFTQALVALEETRQGSAVLFGLDPRELHIVVRSADHQGHMVVEGLIALPHPDPDKATQLRFAPFAIDPTALVDLAREAGAF